MGMTGSSVQLGFSSSEPDAPTLSSALGRVPVCLPPAPLRESGSGRPTPLWSSTGQPCLLVVFFSVTVVVRE